MDAPRVIHIHPEAPTMPALGQPCNGCGVCCLAEPCPLGVIASRRRHGACAKLRWQAPEQRYVCGLLAEPPRWLPQALARRLIARWIAAGVGCDASLEICGQTRASH